jgi:hypothetical protein
VSHGRRAEDGNRGGDGDADVDPAGLDESRNYLTEALGRLVPQSLARRAVTVRVETERDEYAQDEPVRFTVVFRNRLPVPVAVETDERLWGWTVAGELEASDEPRMADAGGGTMRFRGGERKRVEVRWDGRFKRVGRRTRWVTPDPGEYEVAAFLAAEEPRPRDATTIRVVRGRTGGRRRDD